MDIDRPHHFRTSSIGSSSSTNQVTSSSELLICFASRLSSSSSMKLTKSILSPGRGARDSAAPVSLSSSLSRRLRANGSLKGGQASPFLTTPGKKRGGGFENAEPSSPKVTCIGQVRVKTKKKVNQTRSLSKRRSGGVSFRKMEQVGAEGGMRSEDKVSSHQKFSNGGGAHVLQQQLSQECLSHKNQRWVHLPVSICEGLSCLFPCKGSCFSTTEKGKAVKEEGPGENGCGAVFSRWLVSVNDGEGGKRREIELVVGGVDEEEIRAERVSMRSSRRHVFEDIEVKDDRIEVRGQSLEGEEEAARVSICIPPKNALLLMRCRSDPMKMASLASRFSWDTAPPAPKLDEDEESDGNVAGEDEPEEESGGGRNSFEVEDEDGKFQVNEGEFQRENVEEEEQEEEYAATGGGNQQEGVLIIRIQEVEVGEDTPAVMNESVTTEEEEEVESNMSSFEALLDQENGEHYEVYRVQPPEEFAEKSSTCPVTATAELSDGEDVRREDSTTEEQEKVEEDTKESIIAEKSATFSEKVEQNPSENEKISESENQEKTNHEEQEDASESKVGNPENEELVISGRGHGQELKKEKESPLLPDCLLLMMCEPKLSMEVSKETWVCSADFVRWLPERPLKQAKPAKGGDTHHAPPVKRRLSTDSKAKGTGHKEKTDQHLQEPRRSSCSLPPTSAAAAASMAAIIEQKLVNAVAYEPLVLTRCKSEPMRTASAKLMPDSLFWKNAMKKLEPHRQATVGAAGVGF